MKIEFSQKAADDLLSQAAYIYDMSQDSGVADRFLERMRDFIVSILSEFPKAGRAAPEFGEGIRKIVYQRYSILYKIVSQERIVVLTLYRENLPHV